MVKTPGVVFALATAVRALTREGDAVLIQQPVYDPYAGVVKSNKRELVVNPLQCTDGIYTVDYADFEKKIIEHEVKLFLLCSPHNPVGRVWTEEELRKMGEICLKHNVLVVSDEIHCDFTYPATGTPCSQVWGRSTPLTPLSVQRQARPLTLRPGGLQHLYPRLYGAQKVPRRDGQSRG